VADSWEALKARFPAARIVNFSATPLRADGQIMAGRVLYSYPIFRAIQEGYVKRLKAAQLNPRTLRYVRRADAQEIEVSLDEVRRLGEERVIQQNAPGHVLNQGVVVFHAGANIARQWTDFQAYSEADQDYFDQLLPLEGFDPTDQTGEREVCPVPHFGDEIEVRAQSEVQLEEIHLLEEDEAAAIRLLQERGIISGDFDPTRQALQPVPTTRVAQRQPVPAVRPWHRWPCL